MWKKQKISLRNYHKKVRYTIILEKENGVILADVRTDSESIGWSIVITNLCKTTKLPNHINFKNLKDMKPSFLLGTASVLLKNRKAQIILVGLQFGFLVYKLMQDKDKKSSKKIKRLK